MSVYSLDVYWPPSVNSYWRHPNTGKLAGRTLISEKGREYRASIQNLALTNRWPRLGDVRLEVAIRAFPPDKRRRDLDNIFKAALDAMTHAGVWDDDSQIDALSIRRDAPTTGGMLHVEVRAA